MKVFKIEIFTDFYTDMVLKMWSHIDKRDLKIIYLRRGRTFFLSAEFFCISGRELLERVGNTAPRK
jgi:hypothetical protein